MWSGYLTIILLVLFFFGSIIALIKLNFDENKEKRRYEHWK